MNQKNEKTLKKLNDLFGSYRAEWLKERVFDLFAMPSYFTALMDNRPFVLEGGRGTGKTTVLRGLSYLGQYALNGKDIKRFDASSFIGIYYRVNTNHVRAFYGSELSDKKWIKLFGHYFNLVICKEITTFLEWHKQLNPTDEDLPRHSCALIAQSLHIEVDCTNSTELLGALESRMYDFQSRINNIVDGDFPRISMTGDPIKIVCDEIVRLEQFKGKMFYLLLDEYENLEDYQQMVLNTLIKHSSNNYTFKVGVRELGWRIKNTLNEAELLNDPADYVLINIENKLANDSLFSEFAKEVCQQRIKKLFHNRRTRGYQIENALEELTHEAEAELLGVRDSEYCRAFEALSNEENHILEGISNLYRFLIAYWAKHHNQRLSEAVNDFAENRTEWDTRYENYKYEMLFKIRKGRGKRGIQKYYSGWTTYLKIANGNIRYLMELVYRAYERHLIEVETFGFDSKISPKNQTIAAQDVGLKNLMELEGLWRNGAHLTKLLLGFGRIFQVFAAGEGRFAPERNEFTIENSEEVSGECREIINAAVMNLALVRRPGNKLTDPTHTRDYIYAIHPIFAAFFVFSYRKKRKIIVSQIDILGIINSPKITIDSILNKHKVAPESENPLPSQLSLFEPYYET